MPRHLVLVGLSGSGKSTVGPLVAASLDTHFTDIDRVIERATGLPIADLFQEEGEAAFRARERQAVLDGLLLPPHVIAPGGGWAAEPGALDETAGSVTTVYLRVSPGPTS
jgi:shikimate kinase